MLAPTSQIPMLKLKRPEMPANMDLAKLGRRITPFRPILGIQRAEAAIGNQKLLASREAFQSNRNTAYVFSEI